MSNTPGTGDAGMDMGASADEGFDLNDAIGNAFDEITAADTGADTNSGDAGRAAAEQAAAVSADNGTRPETPAAPAAQAPATPDQWTPQEQATFDALPPKTKALVEKRISSIEADYKTKAQLADEVSAVVDQDFAQKLQNSGMTVGQGVAYLANLERFASTKPAEYLAFVAQHVQSMGVDVAQVLGLGGQPAQEAQPNDDGFADPKLAALESRLSNFERSAAEQTRTRVLDDAGRQIAAIRDAKDAEGKPLRPHFAAVENDMAAMIKADPRLTLEEAYDRAVWSNPTVRAEMQKAENEAALRRQRDDANAARRAARTNVRGGGRAMEASPNIKTTDDAVNAAMDAVGL